MRKYIASAEIKIEKLVEGGKGLGFHEGHPVFIPHVLPGETVRAEIKRYRRKIYDGKVLEVLNASSHRVEPLCPYFNACGGCQWQHISYTKQLEWKQKIVAETLQRIGGIPNPDVLPTLPAPQQFGWRSRVTFHGNEAGAVGFYRPNSYAVVDIEECLISEASINTQLRAIRATHAGIKRDYEVRATEQAGFTQVNPLQNETLKKTVFDWVKSIPHKKIIELFCGGGNFTRGLLPLADRLIAVDSDRHCIHHAKQAFTPIAGKMPELHCTDAVRFFAQGKWETLDLLVLDPPRDGAAGIVEGVLKSKPKHVLYISCNPSTLARDLKFLHDFAGYRLVRCQPVDMFPMSFHIETVSLIEPKGS